MEKEKILYWKDKYDKGAPWSIKEEKRLGDKFRQSKTLTKDDLIRIMEWKFESNALVKTVQVNRAKRVNEQLLQQVSNEVFNLDVNQDMKRINLLCGYDIINGFVTKRFSGIGSAVASVILTFYDPHNYCVVDFHLYQELFGIRPNPLNPEKYIEVLGKLREEARKYNLRTRDVEKAYFTKNREKSSCRR